MAESTKTQEAAKKVTVFRNNGNRIYYLRRRDHQAKSEKFFKVLPGQTIEPIDDKEKEMLSGFEEFKDVAKEAPQIGERMAKLESDLAAANATIAKLKAENKPASSGR